MIHNGKQYDKISERFIAGKWYYYYRLRFDDIKQVKGDIYLIQTDTPDVVKKVKGKDVVTKGVKKAKTLQSIKDEIKNPKNIIWQ